MAVRCSAPLPCWMPTPGSLFSASAGCAGRMNSISNSPIFEILPVWVARGVPNPVVVTMRPSRIRFGSAAAFSSALTDVTATSKPSPAAGIAVPTLLKIDMNRDAITRTPLYGPTPAFFNLAALCGRAAQLLARQATRSPPFCQAGKARQSATWRVNGPDLARNGAGD